jgi:hypothetical protein
MSPAGWSYIHGKTIVHGTWLKHLSHLTFGKNIGSGKTFINRLSDFFNEKSKKRDLPPSIAILVNSLAGAGFSS